MTKSSLLRLVAIPTIVLSAVAGMGLSGACPLCSLVTDACGLGGFTASAWADETKAPPAQPVAPPAPSAPSAPSSAPAQTPPAATPPADAAPTPPAPTATPGPMHGRIYKDLDGKPVDMALAVGKPMVIELWATWCGPCRTQRKIMHTLSEEFTDVVFVGASTDEKGPAIVKEFKAKYRADNPPDSRVIDVMSTPQLRQLINKVKKDNTIPQVIYVSRKGEIIDVSIGGQNEKFMRAILNNILKKSKGSQQPATPATPAAPAAPSGESPTKPATPAGG